MSIRTETWDQLCEFLKRYPHAKVTFENEDGGVLTKHRVLYFRAAKVGVSAGSESPQPEDDDAGSESESDHNADGHTEAESETHTSRADKAADSDTDKADDKAADSDTDKADDKAADSDTDKADDKAADSDTDKADDKAADSDTDKADDAHDDHDAAEKEHSKESIEEQHVGKRDTCADPSLKKVAEGVKSEEAILRLEFTDHPPSDTGLYVTLIGGFSALAWVCLTILAKAT